MVTKMLKLVVFALVIGLTATFAQAAAWDSEIWDGGGTDDLWTTAENWVGDVAPLPAERAIIGHPLVTQPMVIDSMTVSVDRIAIGEQAGGNGAGDGVCSLTVTGGSVTTTVSPIIIGHYPPVGSGTLTEGVLDISNGFVTTDNGFLLAMDYNTAGTINMSGGDVTAKSDGAEWNQQFSIGRRGIGTLNMSDGTIIAENQMVLSLSNDATGIVNMTGGTIDVTGDILMSTFDGSNGTSEFNLDGGVITAADLLMGTNARLDITDGVMILDGDDTATVQGYINSGLITGYDGAGTVLLDYNITNSGKTTIAGTPNLPPVVDAGEDQAFVIQDGYLRLNATVTDDGKPVVATLAWTQVSGSGTATFDPCNIEDPCVTFSEAGPYVLRLTADDTTAVVYDEVTITVDNLTCQDVIDAGALAPGDISGPDGIPDCYVNLYDFAAMAGYWLYCNNPQDTECEFPVFPMTKLGVSGSRFTINDKETFLFGISYYAALGASQDFIRSDLNDMQNLGINWLRVWATWAAFDHNVSAVNEEGEGREPYMSQLKWLVAECDSRGIIVDVTLSRGGRIAGDFSFLLDLEVHRKAVETIVEALKPYRNWYFDLSNERNCTDDRYTTFAELKDLRDAAKLIDPECLITASAGNDIPYDELEGYLLEAELDFICPHRPRSVESAGQTQAQSGIYLGWMGEYGRIVPLHYQEPFRRGFTSGWEPLAADYVTDAQGALDGGAAGWCLHNGNNEWDAEGRPRRSFDMREYRLFDALDEEEMTALQSLSQILVDGPIRIMPMGDSVTTGIYGSQVPTDYAYRVGYRYELYNMLNAAGYEFDFVGSELYGSHLFPDVENASIPGIPSDDLSHLLATGWDERWQVQITPGPYFETHPTDVVLLLTGIAGYPNDDPCDVGLVLDEIDNFSEDTIVILGLIPNLMCCTDDPPCSDCAGVSAFNDGVEALALARIANGDNIVIVDMENGAGLDYHEQPVGDMYDIRHPSQSGYDKMAILWYDALKTVLPERDPFVPVFTTNAITEANVDTTYKYYFYAVGSPDPGYAILEGPEGMTIDPCCTGLLQWTPTTADVGLHPVTITASNSEGTTLQSFDLYVTPYNP